MNQKLKDVFKGKVVNKALTIDTGVDEFLRKTKGHGVVPVALRRTSSPIPKPRDGQHRTNGMASGGSGLPGLEAGFPNELRSRLLARPSLLRSKPPDLSKL